MDARADVGRRGEAAAEARYVASGYRVVARNWRCSVGELDIVLVRGNTLVICEVKTRRGARFGGGYEAVDGRKRQKLRTLAEVFVQRAPASGLALRFDVASVWLKPDGSTAVEIFQDAF